MLWQKPTQDIISAIVLCLIKIRAYLIQYFPRNEFLLRHWNGKGICENSFGFPRIIILPEFLIMVSCLMILDLDK